jgi:hypothetical protein
MSEFFGPLDAQGRVPPRQQTWVAAFLLSAHSALARQYAFALPLKLETAWQTELNAQLYHEIEIASLLLRATSWTPDLTLGFMAASWETAWLPVPIEGIADGQLAFSASFATLAHAVHAAIRPAALLPVDANASDPFTMALRRLEFESGRLLQAQIVFLKTPGLVPFRKVIISALERRHSEMRGLWSEMLHGIGVSASRGEG